MRREGWGGWGSGQMCELTGGATDGADGAPSPSPSSTPLVKGLSGEGNQRVAAAAAAAA